MDVYTAASDQENTVVEKPPKKLNRLVTRVETGENAIQIGEFIVGSGSVGEVAGCTIC